MKPKKVPSALLKPRIAVPTNSVIHSHDDGSKWGRSMLKSFMASGWSNVAAAPPASSSPVCDPMGAAPRISLKHQTKHRAVRGVFLRLAFDGWFVFFGRQNKRERVIGARVGHR